MMLQYSPVWLTIHQHLKKSLFRLFPTQDGSDFNYYAQPLQKHEKKVSVLLCIVITYIYTIYQPTLSKMLSVPEYHNNERH